MPVLNSRLSSFYNKSIEDRIKDIKNISNLSHNDLNNLKEGSGLKLEKANHMIENVIGLYSLPFGVATNFIIDNEEFIIPMVVEEPSVIAAASNMAKLTRECGGFKTSYSGSFMKSQIEVINIKDPYRAKFDILSKKEELINIINTFDKTLLSLGGGAKDIEVNIMEHEELGYLMNIHIIVDVLDAMGANAVNTMAEKISPYIEDITGGKVALKILSNLADLRIARAQVIIPNELLEQEGYSGIEVARSIVQSYQIADADPYRAATHNKGIMNGIDPIVLATGNDWRAVEAGAHAYASIDGRYKPLSKWELDTNEDLVGTIEIPMPVGIVGGATKAHESAKISLKLLGVDTSQNLARIIAAVGLAQNLGALKSLATEGIQRGHMSLHARNIAEQAMVPEKFITHVMKKMVTEKNVSVDRAKEILKDLD